MERWREAPPGLEPKRQAREAGGTQRQRDTEGERRRERRGAGVLGRRAGYGRVAVVLGALGAQDTQRERERERERERARASEREGGGGGVERGAGARKKACPFPVKSYTVVSIKKKKTT